MQGRLGEAEDALAELAADLWASGRNPYVAVRTYYALGQVQLTQGRLSAALQTFRQGLELATEAGRRCQPRAWRTWAWPRCCTSATSWTPPSVRRCGPSSCADRLAMPNG